MTWKTIKNGWQHVYLADECALHIYFLCLRNWDRGINDCATTTQVQVAVNTFKKISKTQAALNIRKTNKLEIFS